MKSEKKINNNEIKDLLGALDDLIVIKTFIRKITPTYDLSQELKEEFIGLLKSLQIKVEPLFSKYLEDEEENDNLENLRETIINSLKNENIALVSANSSKKKLKNIGIDPRNVIVTGGPLNANDYKEINPNLPEKALDGIKKKVERVFTDIKKVDWTTKSLIFFHELENLTDKLIIKRINEISNLIGKKIILKKINSWKDLDI